ncbi:hypothetical protein [Bacillus sp. V3-13]|nr:hypothetical protein [Bacillus sp. V3-13]
MKTCEVCGLTEKEEHDETAKVEGTLLHVCQDCQNDRKLDYLQNDFF